MARSRRPAPPRAPRPALPCYQWMYACWWRDGAGRHVYFKRHATIVATSSNYQLASSQARREMLAGLSRYEREIIEAGRGYDFVCRREGPITRVPGPCPGQ